MQVRKATFTGRRGPHIALKENQRVSTRRVILLLAVLGLYLNFDYDFSSRIISWNTKIPDGKLQSEVDLFIRTYQQTVESYVQQQTMSWQRHFTGLEKDVRSEDEIIRARRNMADRPTKGLKTIQSMVETYVSTRRSTQKRPETLNTSIWDYEENIPQYFQHLTQACSQNATEVDSFDTDCWDYLYSIVKQPLCTTRLDSRYKCEGKPSRAVQTAEGLLQNYFTPDTINVAIIGAGPAGLHMANVLSELLHPEGDTQVEGKKRLRVIVFENRVVRNGVKAPYTRDWITDLNGDYYVTVEPLLLKYIETIHDPGVIRLPIQCLETLFLLSSRDRGVKFLYDDFTKYQEILSQIPNLVVFDATGHRLNKLDRSITTGNPATIQPWSWFPMMSEKRYFNIDTFKNLADSKSLVQIAEKSTSVGRVLFPVTRSGKPYVAHLLKINDIRVDRIDWRNIRNIRRQIRSDEFEFCHRENDFSPCSGEGRFCQNWCGRAFAWDSTDFFREDVVNRIREVGCPDNLVLTVFLHSLSAEQSDVLFHILSSTDSDDKERYVADLPLIEMAHAPFWQHNGLSRLFEVLSKIPSAGSATVANFAYRPYLYSDPVTPGGLFGLNRTMVLRVGDSLASGDPNLSTGLGFHIRIIQTFVQQLTLALSPGSATESHNIQPAMR